MSKTIKHIKKIVPWLLSFLDLSGKKTYDNMDYEMLIGIFLTSTRRTCPFNLELKDMVFKAINPTRAAINPVRVGLEEKSNPTLGDPKTIK